jgi:hypothetical protein
MIMSVLIYLNILSEFRKFIVGVSSTGLRAGDRSPVLRLRQGYGACTLCVPCMSGATRLVKLYKNFEITNYY